ncbi:hypothetical protein BJY00DRAFT_315646 [Aspergillus carlsbadensis]|nr:hypothetical protein BJY00DRAFT_315646 [Aspergillus carlsbadensis]
MAHPNTREMDVARSLLHMAAPGDDQNAPSIDRPGTARPMRQRVIKSEPNAANGVGAGTPQQGRQPVLLHAQTPTHYQQAALNNNPQNLREYLVRQQLLAGIAPQNILPMNTLHVPQVHINLQRAPALLQITRSGVTVPHIQAAAFNNQGGAFARPFPGLPYEGYANPTPVFQRPAPVLQRNENYPVPAPAHNFGGYTHNMHQAQGYYGPLAPHFQNLGAYTGNVPNQHGFMEAPTRIPSANGHGYMDNPYGWTLKPDPGAGQQGQGQFVYPPEIEDTQGLQGIPKLKTEPMHEEYGTGNTDGVEDVVRTMINVEPPAPHWNIQQQPNTDRTQGPMLAYHKFNILLSILDHPEVALHVTGHLRVHDVMSLQAVSRSFRAFVVKYLPRIIKYQTQSRLRTASYVFPWRCYQKLWYTRPAAHTELPEGTVMCANDSLIAYSASFRWLQMVRHRDHTVHYIMKSLDAAGYNVPHRFKPAILKLWLLMDIPDTKRRLWTIQNKNLWRDLDLFGAVFFIIRLDMFVKLKRGNPTGGQRRLIMAQPSLTFCYKFLTGEALKDDMELLRAFVRWRYSPLPEQNMNDEEIFGVPLAEVASLQYEGYGKDRTTKLLRPDQIILGEVHKRHLDVKDMYQRIFIHAQEKMFTACERHHSPWDEEMKIALTLDNSVNNLKAACKLD